MRRSLRSSETQWDNDVYSAVYSVSTDPARVLGGFSAAGGVTLRWRSVLFSEE